MKVHGAGGVCCRTRVDDNAGGTLARFSSNVRRYAYMAFYAFGFQSDMPPTHWISELALRSFASDIQPTSSFDQALPPPVEEEFRCRCEVIFRISGEFMTTGESNMGDSVPRDIRATIRCAMVLCVFWVDLAPGEVRDQSRLRGFFKDCAEYQ